MLKSLLLLLFVTSTAISHEQPPFLTILGVGQDAGYPQAGCYAKHCMPGWQDARLKRGAVSLGLVDPMTKKKYMFEATPSFPSQLYDLEVIAPSAEYELSGIFITHAHIGHYAGLMFLGHEAMGASSIAVYAMPRLKKFLTDNGPWGQLVKYKNIILKPLEDAQSKTFGKVKITPFLVPHRDEYSETVGYRIQGPNKSALFIPDINKWDQWNENLAEQIKSVDYALIDAAFYADGELPGRDMSKIPHPFVSETMHLLNELNSKQKSKVWFIHMNHTNPLLNLESKESKFVISQGYNISKEGIQLNL